MRPDGFRCAGALPLLDYSSMFRARWSSLMRTLPNCAREALVAIRGKAEESMVVGMSGVEWSGRDGP